jgi:hypothetical protein
MSTETPAAELPDQVYLPPSRVRWIFTLVASAIIVSLNLYFVLSVNAPALWFFVAIFTFMGALAGAQLIPGSGGLWLDRQGFTYRRFWSNTRREWKKVSPILGTQLGVFGIQVVQMVGFSNEGDAPNKARDILPDTYGVSADELAVLMNHWRDTALKG